MQDIAWPRHQYTHKHACTHTNAGQSKAHVEMQSALRSVSRKDVPENSDGNANMKSAKPLGEQIEDYVPVNKLGQGASGVVYLVKLKGDKSNVLYVLKQVELAKSKAYR
jgi:hypothetical protein